METLIKPNQIQVPYKFQERPYQKPLLDALEDGYKRAVCIWHRRSGKDKTLINLVVMKMFEKVGAYYYFFPTYNQGKKILWNGIDRDGMKFLDHIPRKLIKRKSDSEMIIETKNGSIFQVIGTDNVDSIVGTNPVGCVFSEYSLQDPIAWGYIRPILLENDGWAVFIYTSRGKNHGYDLYKYALSQPDWFVQVLKADETGVFTKEQLEKERKQYIMEDGDDLRYLQEYFCSFEGAVQGSYYGKIIEQLPETHFKKGLYDPLLTVDTIWDLGVGDANAIWFVQLHGNEIRLIDYLEDSGEGLNYYANELTKKQYIYGRHWAPHDIAVRELSSGMSRLEIAKGLGIRFEITPNITIDDGIQAARQILPNCWFDSEKCSRGLDCLRNYHKEYDERRKCYKNAPLHDWSSNGADAFRYLAVNYKKFTEEKKQVVQFVPKNLSRGYYRNIPRV